MVIEMKEAREWFVEQWNNPWFKTLIAVAVILMIGLVLEFRLFQYGMLKIIRYVIVVCCLVVIGWIDFLSRKIPNKILIFMFGARTVLLIIECIVYRELWKSIILSASMGFVFSGGMFLLCYLISRGGVGIGDVKLFAVLGYYMGSGAVFSVMFMTVLAAALFSTIALLLKKTNLKQEIPFAPFIFLGTVLTMALGV